jgi:hypothetical protein
MNAQDPIEYMSAIPSFIQPTRGVAGHTAWGRESPIFPYASWHEAHTPFFNDAHEYGPTADDWQHDFGSTHLLPHMFPSTTFSGAANPGHSFTDHLISEMPEHMMEQSQKTSLTKASLPNEAYNECGQLPMHNSQGVHLLNVHDIDEKTAKPRNAPCLCGQASSNAH